MTHRRRQDAIAIAILALLPTVLFIDVLAGRGCFFLRDLAQYYYPAKQILRDIVLGGEFPFWNRFFAAGQPLAANPEHEVFYPLTWLILLPDYFLGFRLLILSHVYIGILGMYALLRSMNLGARAAFFGAVSFGLGGTFMSYINLLPIFLSVAWMPLTCLFTRSFLLRPRWRSFALASIFFGLQMLVGEPTTILQTGFLLGMYALYRGWYAAKDAERSWKAAAPEMLARVACIGLITLAAVAIGAVQLIPAIDHVGDSVRSRTFSYGMVSSWSMPWKRVLDLLYPNWLGYVEHDGRHSYWGDYGTKKGPFIFSIYHGLLATVLALSALFSRIRGSRFVLFLCMISLLLATGANGPLLRPLYDLGIAGSLRYPEKFALIGIFALAIFSAQGFERLLSGDARICRMVVRTALAAGLVAALIAATTYLPAYAHAFWTVFPATRASSRLVELSREGWMVAAFRATVLALLAASISSIGRRRWANALLLFAVVDLAAASRPLNPWLPARFFRDVPTSAQSSFPVDRGAFRVFNEAEWITQLDNDPNARKYNSTRLLAKYLILRNGLFPYNACRYGLQLVMETDFDLTALLPTTDFMISMRQLRESGRDWWRPLAAMSNVWYRGTYKPYAAELRRAKGRANLLEPVQFVRVGQQPRYYLSDQIVTIRDREDFTRKLRDGRYSDSVAFVTMPAFAPASGVVHGWRETANTASIDVESRGRGFLVMSVTPHKYWRIEIDGVSVAPIVTNIGFQGVVVPSGRHRVEMRYRNDLVVESAKISLAALLLALVAVVWPNRRGRIT